MADAGHGGGGHGGGDHAFFGHGPHGHAGGHSHGAAHGSLLSGLAPGHGYVHHEHVAGHGPVEAVDHFSIADAETLAFFISEAMSHGGPSAQHSSGLGNYSEVAGLHGWMHASNSDPGRKFNLPGVERNLYAVTARKWPHRPFVDNAKTISEMVEPLKKRLFQKAHALGMVICPVDKWNPRPIDGNKPIDTPLPFLASNEPFGPGARDMTNPPDFWYENAEGLTYLMRFFFQHSTLANLPGAEKYRTYTVATIAVWWARKRSSDCQTTASFSVWAKPYHNVVWKPVWTQVRLHRAKCEDLAEDTQLFLNRYTASRQSIAFREQLTPKQLEPYNPAKLPAPALVAPIVPVSPTFVGNGEGVVLPDGSLDPRI